MTWIRNLLSMYDNLATILASAGLVLATSSFISGLQLVKSRQKRVERKIHRGNGYLAISVYIGLMFSSILSGDGGLLKTLAWLAGLGLISLKLRIVRRKGRSFKYVSWLGAILILLWLFLVFVHIPGFLSSL